MDEFEVGLDSLEGKFASKRLHMYTTPNTEISRSADTPLYLKKEQKINDRLQDKINILKAQAQVQEPPRQPLQSSNSK
jgi:hypothetical protein